MAVALRLKNLRWATLVVAALNLGAVSVGSFLLGLVLRRCGGREKVPVTAAVGLGLVRVGSMVGAGIAQGMTAVAIAGGSGGGDEDADFRRVRRVRYRRWLWWTRFGMVVTVLQLAVALYVMYIIVRDISNSENANTCFLALPNKKEFPSPVDGQKNGRREGERFKPDKQPTKFLERS